MTDPIANRPSGQTQKSPRLYQLATETRPSIRTSEFIVLIVTSLLVIFVAYADEEFNIEHGWTLVAAMAIGYMLSRGIAKAGSSEPYVVEQDR